MLTTELQYRLINCWLYKTPIQKPEGISDPRWRAMIGWGLQAVLKYLKEEQ